MRATMRLDVRALTGAIGAEIHGVNLREPVAEDLRAELRAAWLEHLVLFFPGQDLNSEQHKAFGRIWGALESYAPEARVRSEGDPGLVELAASKGYTSDIWHTDLTHVAHPPMGSVVQVVKLPAVGGDTMWSNQYLAYETLSAPMRALLTDLTAIHEYKEMGTSAEHRIVRVHPETGRRCLYINYRYTARIPQLSRAESDSLLAFLRTHSIQPEFTVRYRWSTGTVAVWDNRCTQHVVINDFDGERIVQRVTFGDDAVETLDGPWEHFKPRKNSVGHHTDSVSGAN